MGSLNRFESRLEHMVTGAFARVFRSAVQPVEIAAALQREIDNSAQILSRDRRLAPNDFTIDLSPADFDRLSSFGDAMSRELAGLLHQHAADQHYVFAGPVRLNFQRADELSTGRFRVRSAAAASVTPTSAARPSGSTPPTPVPMMYLEISGTRHPVSASGVVVGRGTTSSLRIDDPGISRRHAEFRVELNSGGTVGSVTDLGSTNGTVVNGQRVQRATLSDGAVVEVGATRILVRLPDQNALATPPGSERYGASTSPWVPPSPHSPPPSPPWSG